MVDRVQFNNPTSIPWKNQWLVCEFSRNLMNLDWILKAGRVQSSEDKDF